MKRKLAVLLVWFFPRLLAGPLVSVDAQQQKVPDIRVDVNMVQLNVAVTDNKGNYVTGLRPSDFTNTSSGTASCGAAAKR